MVRFIVLCLFISLHPFAQSESLVDPTKPTNFQAGEQNNRTVKRSLPKLQSIIIKSGKSQAIINDMLYQQGGVVNGFKIISIEEKIVWLKYKNETYKIALYSADEHFID